MNILNFADLLAAARQQPEPQLLLFVFARAELPEGATEEQKKNFAAGAGGALTPVLCVDKTPDELTDFAALAAESQQTGQPWDLVFASSLSGHAGIMPTTEQAEQPLQMMVQAIHSGKVASLLALDKQGQTLSFY
jgi:hypothetical protein